MGSGRGSEERAGKDRVELLLRASDIAVWAGDADRALEYARAARDGVDELTEPLSAAAAETRIGRAMWNAGHGDDAIEHLAAARRLVPAEPPSVGRAEALAGEGRALMLAGHITQSGPLLEEALAIARGLGTKVVVASSLNTLAIVYGNLGDRQRAIAAGREGLRIAREIDSAEEVGRGLRQLQPGARRCRVLAGGAGDGREGIIVARRNGMDRSSGDQLRVQAAWRLARMGRLKEAGEVIAPALEAATTPFNVAATSSIAGHLATERGELEVGQRSLEEALALMQRSGGFQLIGPAVAWLVSTHLWKGDLERARALARDGVERAAGAEGDLIYTAEIYWLAVRIEADIAGRARTLRDESEITRALNAAVAGLAELESAVRGMPGDGAPPESFAFRALATAELARLKADADPAPWIAAADRFRRLGELSRVAYADLRMAEALAASGAPGNLVAERLRAAHAVAGNLGLVMFANQVQATARGQRIELDEPRKQGSSDETDRGLVTQLGLADHELEVVASALPSGVNTVLFSDIEDSTLLLDRLGDEPFMQVLHQHNRVVREQIARYDGQEIKTAGDSFMVAFGQPRRALACAVEIQRAVVKIEPAIRVRIGLHAGETVRHGDDLFGRHVVIAARVAALAAGGEILVTSLVRELAEGAHSLRFGERREHALKGLSGLQSVFSLEWTEDNRPLPDA